MVHMFGTNFDIEFCNHEKLQTLPGNMKIFHSQDKGNRKIVKLCKALALKKDCAVNITQKLSNGLVNRLTGSVTNMTNDQIAVKLYKDPYLKYRMEGKSFTLEQANFAVWDVDGDKVAQRKQFPIKLGYATTVDQSTRLYNTKFSYWLL